MPTQKIGILVVGMHRSGTSATAKLLNILGAALPGNLMPPHSEINAKGFWESYDVASLNDALLSSYHSRWDDVLSVPIDDIDQDSVRDFESRAMELLERDFSDTNLFVLKDPRISRLLPYWLRVFERMSIEPRVVISVRHPLDVADSLKRRDKFQKEKSIYLWLRHLVDAERASRNVPRAFVLYDDMLEDWRSSANGLSETLGIEWPVSPDTVKRKVGAFLDVQLRHHHRKTYRLKSDNLVANLAKELYSKIQSGDYEIAPMVDSIYTGLLPSETLLAPILQDISSRFERSEHLLGETRQVAAQLESNFNSARALLTERDTELGATRQHFDQLSAEFEAKCLHVNQLIDEAGLLKEALSSTQVMLDERDGELDATRQHFDKLAAEFEAKCRHVEQLSDEADQLKAALSPTQAMLEERDGELDATRQHFDQLSAEFEAKCQHVNQLAGEAEQLREALATTQSVLDTRDGELDAARLHFHQLNAEFEAKCRHVEQLSDEAAQLKEALSSTQAMLDERDGELDVTRQHFDKLSAEFEAKCQHVNQLAGEAEQLREALATTQSVLDTRDGELDTARLHFHQINAEFEAKCRHVEQLSEEAGQLKEALSSAQEMLDERDGELDATRQHFDKLSAEFEAKCRHVNQLAGEAKQLRKALATTQSVLDTRDGELDAARLHFHQINAEFEAKCRHVEQLSDEAAQLREALSSTQAMLDERDGELNATRQHFDELSAKFEAKCLHVNQLVEEAGQLREALSSAQEMLNERDGELDATRQHFDKLATEFEAKCQHVNQLVDEAAQLKEALSSTQEMLEERDGELDSTRQHFDKLSAEFEAKCLHVNQLSGEADQLREALATTQSVLDTRDGELDTARLHFHQLNAEFEAKCRHVEQLSDEAGQLKAALSSAQEMLDERDGELDATRQHFDKLSAEFEAKCLHVSQLSDEASQLKAALDERDTELDTTRQHFDKLSAEFEAKCLHVNQLVDEAVQLKEALSSAQEMLDERDGELDATRQHFDKLSAEFEAKCLHVNQLVDEAGQLKAALDERDTELDTTRQHFDKLSAEFEAKCLHVNQLVDEAGQLKAALDERDTELDTTRQHFDKLSAEFESKCLHVNQLVDEAGQLKEALSSAQEMLDERDGELDTTRQHFDKLSAEFEAKCLHVKQLSNEAAQLKEALSSTQEMLDERDAELDASRQYFDILSAEFDAKCQHVNQLVDEAAQLKGLLSTTQSTLSTRDVELSNALNDISAANSSISGLTSSIADLRTEQHRLTAEKAHSINRIESISNEIGSAITITGATNTERMQMSQNAGNSQSIQPSLESLQEQTVKIIALTQVNNSQLQGAATRLIAADQAIRRLFAKQEKGKGWKQFFRKKSSEVQLLESTTLFDVAFYVSSHMEVLSSEMTPYEHYLDIGINKGWDPHPLFSTSWYLEQNRDVAQSGMNPLIHFLKHGAEERRSPHPLFDMTLYLTAYPQVAASGMNVLEHYLLIGGQAGFRPHWLFDGKAYLDNYPEVRAMGLNPLLHYLQFGHLKNYRPHWAFDPVYYLVNNPGVASLGISPLVHFITKGARQRLNPNAEFDIVSFIEQHPFLEHSDDNPLAYHVSHSDYQAVFNPPAPTQAEPPAPPATPEHSEVTGQPLPVFMDFLYDEFGVDIRTDIVTRMQRFHLPFTSEKITPNPTEQEVAEWVTEVASLSEAMGDMEYPDVSIVIPVYNQLPFTLACIHSVLSSQTRYSYEIIVADDRSTDRTTEIFSQGVGRIRHVLAEQNQGFIRNCNNAARHAKGRYLVLLNNDTIVMPGWLDELIGPLEANPDIGLVGSKLLYPDGRLQESGGIIFADGSGWNYGRTDDPRKPQYCYMRDADYVSGASIALRTEFWHAVGGFDEQYSVAYYEDADMAFQVRQAGLRSVVQPLSQLLHFEGISSGTDTSSGAKQYQVTNAAVFRDKWSPVLSEHGQCDPERLPSDRTALGRVLVIDACTPTPDRDAGSIETFQHLRILRSFGLHVTFVPENLAHIGRYTQDLQRLGVETLYAPYWMTFEDILKKLGGTYDLVLIYRAPIAARLLHLVREHAPQAKVIFDTIDLHFLREEREAKLTGDPQKAQTAAETRKSELKLISQADATIILSSHEMSLLRDLLPQANLYEIPIVSTIPGAGPLGFAERRDIVFIGGFRHAPNADGVKWFVGEIWPLLQKKGFEGRFVIVGADMPPEITNMHQSDIEVRGYVPDIKDVFNTCRLSVAPIRFGAGLKGKVISSLSFGVPVVATSIAVEGSGFTHDQHVLVADEPEEFADSIIRLYGDQEMWENLSQSGLGHCNRSFSVSVISAKLRSLINDIAPDLNIKKIHVQ